MPPNCASIFDVLKAGDMPPPSKPRPTAGELEAFTKFGDVFEKHDRIAKADPGRVTMRRLNRNEYNNAARRKRGN